MEFWQHSNPYTALFLFTAEMESFKRNLGRCGIKTGNEIVGAKGGPPRRVPGGQLEDGEAGTRKLVSKPKPRQRLLSRAFKREMKRWNTVPGQHGCVDPAEATCKIINCNFGFDTSIRVFSLFIPLLLFFGRVPGHLPAPPRLPLSGISYHFLWGFSLSLFVFHTYTFVYTFDSVPLAERGL